MKILIFLSDTDGCYHYRVRLPCSELKRFGVETTEYCFIPNSPLTDSFSMLCNMIKEYDLIIIQRCYLFQIVETICTVCQFLGKPTCFETDDDYLSLIPSNPAFFAICEDQNLFRKFYDLNQAGNRDEAAKLVPGLMANRNKGLEGYKKLLGLVDWVTVSTEELARTIYPYNKNVMVFPNNIERVFPWRDSMNVDNCLKPIEGDEGKMRIDIPVTLGLFSIPNYQPISETAIKSIPRIGYTGTPSHIGEDYDTIKMALNKFHNDHARLNDHFLVLFDDPNHPYFYNSIKDKHNLFTIPPSYPYEKYMYNVRNIDIGLAPLMPMAFNQSKSEIKLMEYSAWQSCSLVPNYITYTRSFKNEETCLTYNNDEEFVYQLERLVKDYNLRTKLGNQAYEYVKNFRLEKLPQNCEKRFQFYSNVVAGKKQLDLFKPNKELVNVSSK